jgi:hypothetical protein
MLPREEKYIRDWEIKQSRGKWQYIILTAIVWGTLIPFIVKLFVLAAQGLIWTGAAWRATFFTRDYLQFSGYFYIALFSYALMMWQLAAQKYKQLKQKQLEEESGHGSFESQMQ